MKVVFLVANLPGDFCGVYNYTEKLAEALGDEVVVERIDRWSFAEAMRIRQKYQGQKDILFHLQYPSRGMEKSLAPGFLPVLLFPHKVFVTLHEFSVFNPLRKLIFLPYAFIGRVVFTNDYEKTQWTRFFRFKPLQTNIIPIGNNITVMPRPPTQTERLVYFGQIVEGKGVEFFLDTVALLRQSGVDTSIAVIGAMMDKSSLTQRLNDAAQQYDVMLYLDRSEEDVSTLLHDSSVALLPFPDGLSEKRGSALACLAHGLQLVTKHTEKTPEWLAQVTFPAETPQEAADQFRKILCGTKRTLPDHQTLQNRTWPAIAQKHRSIYSTSG